jgi:hypothetical protein
MELILPFQWMGCLNMVSHAHGQGYADFAFVIPETVEKIDFGKGTYASKGILQRQKSY